MNTPRYDKVQVGDALPTLELSPISRTTLALFAGASGDHNPIHIDTDFARKAGMPDVFAHGMLGMAWLGRLLTNWAPQSRLRRFDVRGLGLTGGVITSAGLVLAATFAALAVIPLVFMAQIAFMVAVGVLIDTFIVRALLVSGLGYDLGRAMWRPSRLGDRLPKRTRMVG